MNSLAHTSACYAIFGTPLPRRCFVLGVGGNGEFCKIRSYGSYRLAASMTEASVAKEKTPLSKGACDAEKRRGIDNRLPFVYIYW